jgi:hypothetical protein
MRTSIGKIVKSNTHIDYVCQVYNPGEIDAWPQPADYSFGTFVAIRLDDNGMPGGQIIGVIYNTLLMNPDFGSLGPRLSPRQELEIFTPDYLAETATLVGIIAVGWIDAAGVCHQGVPALAPTVNNPVYQMDDGLSSRRPRRGGAALSAAAAWAEPSIGAAAPDQHCRPVGRAFPRPTAATGVDA